MHERTFVALVVAFTAAVTMRPGHDDQAPRCFEVVAARNFRREHRLQPRAAMHLRLLRSFHYFLAAAALLACSGGTDSVVAGGGSAALGSPIDPACGAGGTIFEESGTNRVYPYETAKTEVAAIVSIVATPSAIAFARGSEVAAIRRGERATRDQLTLIARDDAGTSSTSGSVEGLGLAGDRLVWFDSQGMRFVPLAGGAPVSVGGAQRGAFASDTIFTATNAGGGVSAKSVVTIEKREANGAPSPLAKIDGRLTIFRHLLAEDADALYLETFGSEGSAGVFRVAKADGATKNLLSFGAGGECNWVLVDGETLLASCLDETRRPRLVRFSKTDGSGLTVVAPSSPFVRRPLLEDGAMYGFDGYEPSTAKRLMRMDFATGNTTEMLAVTPPSNGDGKVTSFAREGRCFYAATQTCECVEKTSRFNKGTGGTDEVCAAFACTNRIERIVEPGRR